MPSDSKDQRHRRDPTGAMIGAAIRAGHRRRPETGQKPESAGTMIVTTLVLAVILFGTLFVMLTYGPKQPPAPSAHPPAVPQSPAQPR